MYRKVPRVRIPPHPPDFALFPGRAKAEHPADAELIGQHPKAPAPERVVQRHGDLAVFTKGVEYFLHFGLGLAVEADREIVPLLKSHARECAEAIRTAGPLASSACKILSGVSFAIADTSGGPAEKAVKLGSAARHRP